jgi:uncharacterized membrane protein HdeD (DUF308 family)
MDEVRNKFIGLLAIILGIIIITFPLIGVSTLSDLTGIIIIFIGIWLLAQCFKKLGTHLAAAIANLLIGIFAIFVGIVFLLNVATFEFITFLGLYLVGFFMIISGITYMFSGKGIKYIGIGILGVLLGIVYMIIAMYVANPFFLAAIIGAFLIIAGIMEIFIIPKQKIESKNKGDT